MNNSLWPEAYELSVIGVAGEPNSGKTLFALAICPGPETLHIDLERSAVNYRKLGFAHIDVVRELPRRLGRPYTPAEAYEFVQEVINSTRYGQYRVIVIDPLEALEDGIVASVKKNYAKYGFTSQRDFERCGGAFWKAVRDSQHAFVQDIEGRCETFCFTVHMRQVFGPDGKPLKPKKLEPKGKSTNMQLAQLFLQLDRIGSGKPPAADVLKARLGLLRTEGGVMCHQILPDRLPEATPDKIRYYILNPPDFGNLAEGERPVKRQLSEQDKLALEIELAEARRAAADAERLTIEAKTVGANTAPGPSEADAAWLEKEAIDLAVEKKMRDGISTVLRNRGVEVAEASPMLLTPQEFDRFKERLAEIRKQRGDQ